ncbi:hypothetical protein HY621_00995 [Candidatus Uhrbacteria bacterium]|nr:hypothetical protein [Candidatus Uhrbacteria bacterium]
MKQLITNFLFIFAVGGAILFSNNMFEFLKKNSQSNEEKFWKWFVANEKMLFSFHENQDQVFDMLTSELSKVNKNLTFEFGPIREQKREFIISADGIRDAFPFVERLAAQAPPLEKWKITKFRPRRPLSDTVIDFKGKTFSPDDIFFKLHNKGGKVGIRLFIKRYNEDKDVFDEIVFIFLDAALGEYDVETKVASIDFFDTDTIDFANAKPMTELAENFDAMQ